MQIVMPSNFNLARVKAFWKPETESVMPLKYLWVFNIVLYLKDRSPTSKQKSKIFLCCNRNNLGCFYQYLDLVIESNSKTSRSKIFKQKGHFL